MKRAKRSVSTHAKKSAKYAVAAVIKNPGDFEILHAAHRSLMAEALATLTATELRRVAQVFGLAIATARRDPSREVPERVITAVNEAEATLVDQITQLDEFADARNLEPVALREPIAHGASVGRQSVGCKPSAVKLEIPARLTPAAARRGDVAEIMFALVANACKAISGRANGQVRISAAAHATAIRVTVEDNGPGIAPAARRRLFDPLVTTRQSGRHFGIGLAVARELAQRNGGDVVLDSVPVSGTRFSLTLPTWNSVKPAGRTRR